MIRPTPMHEQINQLKAHNKDLQDELQEQALKIARLEQRQRSIVAVLKNGLAIIEDDNGQ